MAENSRFSVFDAKGTLRRHDFEGYIGRDRLDLRVTVWRHTRLDSDGRLVASEIVGVGCKGGGLSLSSDGSIVRSKKRLASGIHDLLRRIVATDRLQQSGALGTIVVHRTENGALRFCRFLSTSPPSRRKPLVPPPEPEGNATVHAIRPRRGERLLPGTVREFRGYSDAPRGATVCGFTAVLDAIVEGRRPLRTTVRWFDPLLVPGRSAPLTTIVDLEGSKAALADADGLGEDAMRLVDALADAIEWRTWRRRGVFYVERRLVFPQVCQPRPVAEKEASTDLTSPAEDPAPAPP